MLAQHTRARVGANGGAPAFRQFIEPFQRLAGGPRNQDFAAGVEKGIEPRPFVAQYRGAASGGLEKPHTWRIARLAHLLSRQVQRKPLRAIKSPMLGRGKMADSP